MLKKKILTITLGLLTLHGLPISAETATTIRMDKYYSHSPDTGHGDRPTYDRDTLPPESKERKGLKSLFGMSVINVTNSATLFERDSRGSLETLKNKNTLSPAQIGLVCSSLGEFSQTVESARNAFGICETAGLTIVESKYRAWDEATNLNKIQAMVAVCRKGSLTTESLSEIRQQIKNINDLVPEALGALQ